VKFFFIIILFFIFIHYSATNLVFIEYYPFSTETNENNLAFFLIKNFFEELNIELIYTYCSLKDALIQVDNAEDVIVFPYVKPKVLSIYTFASEPIYVNSDKIFYNRQDFFIIDFHSLHDLKKYVFGSSEKYKNERLLRIEGLTVHYSENNETSFDKLINHEIDFVFENQIIGLTYLKRINDSNVKYFDESFFIEDFIAITSVKNENATNIILKINELVNDKNYYNNLLKIFFENNFIIK
jgi:hypothetical protein